MKVIGRILYKKKKSSKWRYGQPLLRKLIGVSQQRLLCKLKNYKPYGFYLSVSAMPESKRFSCTNKIET